jgi:hypothetical protein
MFIFLIDRHGSTHVVDYQNSQGRYRTLCSKIFTRKDNITTLAADNTFSGLCRECKRYYDDMYNSDLEDDLQMVRSNQNGMYSLLDFHRAEIMGPKDKHELSLERVWTKLIRARSQLKKLSKYYGK